MLFCHVKRERVIAIAIQIRLIIVFSLDRVTFRARRVAVNVYCLEVFDATLGQTAYEVKVADRVLDVFLLLLVVTSRQTCNVNATICV